MLRIEKTGDENILRQCAQLMSSTEPWITLERNYDQCLSVLCDELSHVYAAYDDEKFIGFVNINLKGQFVGYIRNIVLHEQYRGKGVGTKMILLAEEIIFKIHRNVFICVSSFNREAKKLYERLGYEYTGVLKNFVVNGHDEIILRKTKGPLNA